MLYGRFGRHFRNGRLVAPREKQPLSFKACVRSAATELRGCVESSHLKESTPGSLGEAVALLTARDMLYPVFHSECRASSYMTKRTAKAPACPAAGAG